MAEVPDGVVQFICSRIICVKFEDHRSFSSHFIRDAIIKKFVPWWGVFDDDRSLKDKANTYR